MYCNTCGSNVPDGATHCNICGAALTPAQPTHSYAPTSAYTPAPGSAPSHRVKKSEYLKSYADPATKKLGLIAWIVAAACLVILFLSMNATLNGSFFEIPVFKLVLEDADPNFEDEMEDLLDEAQDNLELLEDDLSKSELKEYKEILEAWEDCFSINNIKKAGELLGEQVEEETAILSTFSSVAVVITLIAAALLALGALTRAGGWVIAGMIVGMLYSIILSGTLYTVLIAVSFIALTVILSKINTAYKNFRRAY